MASDNLSLVLHGKEEFRYEQTPVPEDPGPDELQLAIHSVGICGSDLHFWKNGRVTFRVVKDPIILGHEASAVVVKVGQNVKNFQIGDRVAIEPGISCLKCKECLLGHYNLCPNNIHHGVPTLEGGAINGSLRRLLNHPVFCCHKLPDNVSLEEGALIEPLAIAVYACQKAKISVGLKQKILITGAGPMGLLTALSARALGAESVCVTDINQNRLKLAKELGLQTLHVNPNEETTLQVKRLQDIFGSSADITIECTSAEASVRLAILATRDGGRVVLVGLGPHEVTIPLSNAAIRELTLLGVRRCRNTYPLAIQLVSDGKMNIKPLISHKFKLEEAVKAFETASDPTSGSVKVFIECFKKS